MPAPRVRAPTPRRARQQRVDEILLAARDLFCARGYAAVSVAEIAAQVGVVEGLVYKYFASKRALLLAVLAHWYDQLFGDCTRELAAVGSPRLRLRLLVQRHLRAVQEQPQLCRLMFREVREDPGYLGSELHARNRRYTRVLVDVIREGQRTGVFEAGIAPELVRDLIYGGIEHASWRHLGGRGGFDLEAITGQLTALVCNGLCTPRGRLARKPLERR